MKLTEQAQARIRRCVDNLIDEKTGMSKGQIYGYCTNLEKAGKLDDSGHWAKEMTEAEMIEALQFVPFAEIKGLPVFRAGSYHGGKDTYSDADIDAMPEAFEATREAFKRPVKLTHKGKENPLAFGTIDRAYTAIHNGAKTLMLDLANVPQQFADWMKAGRLLGHSVELYKQFQGKANVLRGIAFLGSDIPEVKGLTDDLSAYVAMESEPDHITIEFTADSQEHSHEDTEAAPVGDGSNVNSNQRKESSRVENFKQFATKEEYDAHVAALKADLVPKSELDALKQRQEQSEQASYFAEIDTKVAGLIKPNEHGKSLPVFVRDKLAPVLKTIPRTSQFGEAGKEVPVIDAIVSIFAEVSKVGLADYRETTGTSGSDHADTSKEAELRKEFRESKELFADISITEDQYVAIHMRS